MVQKIPFLIIVLRIQSKLGSKIVDLKKMSHGGMGGGQEGSQKLRKIVTYYLNGC
jgi:hypothetical protein